MLVRKTFMKRIVLYLVLLLAACTLVSAEIRNFTCTQQAIDRNRCPVGQLGNQLAELRLIMSITLRDRIVGSFSHGWPSNVTCNQDLVDSGDCSVSDLGDPDADPPVPPTIISNPVTQLDWANNQLDALFLERTYRHERRKSQREIPQPTRDSFLK